VASQLGETVDEPSLKGASARARPGVVVVTRDGRPACEVLASEAPILVGREVRAFADDDRLSRRHATIEVVADGFRVTDLGSRNGTYVDGERIARAVSADAGAVVRMGRVILLLVDDVTPFQRNPVADGAWGVIGPRVREVLASIEAVVEGGGNLLVRGESGTGKERLATFFHERVGGPFVPVNCSTIPETLAERLMLGSRRGAFSGASDSEGFFSAADGGVLFLDEVAELDLDVQTKLLRVLETQQVTPLGGTRFQSVRVRVVFATHRDLRALVAAGRFRADLYYRIEKPAVTMLPLRDRREEIPWLIRRALGDRADAASPAFVEACMIRPWPGNIRELLHNVTSARAQAVSQAAAAIMPEHLDPAAGIPVDRSPETEPRVSLPSFEEVRRTLAEHDGNVSASARALGLHRTQLRRLMERFGMRG
jgi:transcriptional regulator with GAF, ATPase, and Fis domain